MQPSGWNDSNAEKHDLKLALALVPSYLAGCGLSRAKVAILFQLLLPLCGAFLFDLRLQRRAMEIPSATCGLSGIKSRQPYALAHPTPSTTLGSKYADEEGIARG